VGQSQWLFYVLDRTSGEFLLGKPFVEVNWMNGFDEKGRPMRSAAKFPVRKGRSFFRAIKGDQLVFAFLQPAHRFVLHSHLGRIFLDLR